MINVYHQYGKNNLYNKIIKSAAFIGEGEDAIQCKLGLKQILNLIPELEKKPESNWQRMLNEVWIGELAHRCQNNQMAKKYLNAGLKKSKTVYKQGSIGQKLIDQRVKILLN